MVTKDEIIEINKKQKEFYNTKKKNLPTKIWSYFREKVLKDIRKELGVLNQCYDLHQNWFGDLSDKKVLDLGCFSGNYLSLYLAKNAKSYIGLDLSEVGIERLQEKLKDIPTAKAMCADFLSDMDFPDKDFDFIYAYGVLHHFQSPDILIQRLNEKLSKNGVVISYDPLETSLPIKILRTIYRPFQSDSEWEWPFTKKTFKKFEDNFKVLDKHGLFGKSKWVFLLNFIPISNVKRLEIGKRWHEKDWELSAISNEHLFKCMHVTMRLEKK